MKRITIIYTAFLVLSAAFGATVNAAQVSNAQSPLSWRLGPAAWSFKEFTFFEAIDKTRALGIYYIEAFQGQRLSDDSDLTLDITLGDDVLSDINRRLNRAGVTLTSIYMHNIPRQPAECRKLFELCRKLNIETIVSEPPPEDLDAIEKLCNEYKINLAIHNHAKGKSRYWNPRYVAQVCYGRSKRIGACCDTGHWQRSGISPVEGVKILEGRIISLHVKDLNVAGPEGHDVPWGTGEGEIADTLGQLHRQGVQPTIIAIEYEHNWKNSMPEMAQCVRYFRQVVNKLTANEPLYVGWASRSITPKPPVALRGQMHLRIAEVVNDPITCTALAIETRNGDKSIEQALMVSCDLCIIEGNLQEKVREKLKAKLADFDLKKLFLNATHTHTAPHLEPKSFRYEIPKEGVLQPAEYVEFASDRICEAAIEAWKNRKPAGMSWGLAQAVVGHNRRVTYLDGHTQMYGRVNKPDFDCIEGYEDHGLEMLFFWTPVRKRFFAKPARKLTGILINLPCPSQETEQSRPVAIGDRPGYKVSADFWHEVRQELRKRYSKDLFIFPQCSAAGDQSPHLIWRKDAEAEMRKRKGITSRQEIALRIADAVDSVFAYVKSSKDKVIFKHAVDNIKLPVKEKGAEPLDIELHVIRLDDVAICTNPFELYLDYGLRIEARSKAVLTLTSQLTAARAGYLPTPKACPPPRPLRAEATAPRCTRWALKADRYSSMKP